jgi:AP endonuclease 1
MPPKKRTTVDATIEDQSPTSKGARRDDADTSSSPADAVVTRKASSSAGNVVTAASILEGTVPFVRKTQNEEFEAKSMLKVIAWNVAGLRALLKKDKNPLQTLVETEHPDLLCLQETKLSDPTDADKVGQLKGYTFVDSISTSKKGYSGTRTYVRDTLDATHLEGFDVLSGTQTKDDEGRILTTFLNGGTLAIVNAYVPNSGMTLDRLDYRTTTYDPMMRGVLQDLSTRVGPTGSVIWTGDLNVAERDYDRYFATNFKAMQKVPGFTPEERASFRKTLKETDMIDSFRHVYPNAANAYTFWSARFNSKAKGNGWRLDYFVVSSRLADRVVDSFMLPDVAGSDHCPIVLWLKK